jgi:hypothetical protein
MLRISFKADIIGNREFIDVPNSEGKTALHEAAQFLQVSKLIVVFEFLKYFLLAI